MTSDPSLSIRPLPSRVRSLPPDDLRDVFGGCTAHKGTCDTVKAGNDCCPGLECNKNWKECQRT